MKSRALSRLSRVAALAVGLAACGGSGGGEPIDINLTPQGGTVTLAGGNVILTVPAGAVSQNMTVTATPVATPADPRLMVAYDFTPDGTTFAQPVTLKIKLGALPVPSGLNLNTISIFKVVGGQWVQQTNTGLVAADTSISISISSFSTYGVMIGNVGPAGAVLDLQTGVRLTVPQNALTEPQLITAAAAPNAPANNRRVSGTAFDFSPGLNFASNATLRLSYSPANIPAFVPENTLGVFWLNGTTWQRAGNGTRDTVANTVSAPISAFATFTVMGDSVGGGGPPPTTNEPAGFTLISNRFFNAKVEDGWLDRGDAAFTITADASAPFSAPTVGVANYFQGFAGGSGPINTRRPVDTFNYTKLYFGFWLKFSANWEGHNTGVNKIIFVWIAGQPRVFIRAQGSGSGPFVPRVNLQNDPGNRSTLPGNINATKQMVPGTWHFWEVELRSNTAGNADGTIRLWLDGVQITNFTDVQFVTAAEGHKWEEVSWNPTWGGAGSTTSVAMDMRMDHIRISGSP